MQLALTHANRVATMGQLTASIAHEVSQPMTASVNDASAALRFLNAHPPDLEEVRQALEEIAHHGQRAGEVLGRIRGLVKKAPPQRERLDINKAIFGVIALTRSEVVTRGVLLQTDLAEGLPLIDGDPIQLQQVIVNLVLNALEAMDSNDGDARELQITTTTDASSAALVAVRDTGPGLDPTRVDRLFEAFYTTKPTGMGMGLSISRSIVEDHGGRLWASPNAPRGAIFQFTVPTHSDNSS